MTKTQIPSYPKVWAVGAPAVATMFSHGDEVVVQEKIDGSQVSFGKVDGELVMRSKGQPLYAENPDGMFKAGIEAIVAIGDRIPDGMIFRGEYLNRPKHNTLAYERVPTNHIILFDMQMLNYETAEWEYCDEGALHAFATLLDFDVVPELARGIIDKPADLTDLLERESFLGGPKIEGFVVKNYARLTRLGDQMFAKYVSGDFKEKHTKSWKNRNPTGKDFVGLLADEFATPARFTKAVQHLRDAGRLVGEPRDIGPLMKELADDLVAEHEDYIRDRLWAQCHKDIIRGAARGFPEWYKAQLLDGAFAQEPEPPAEPFLIELIEPIVPRDDVSDIEPGYEQRWWCEPPAEGVGYVVIRESWHDDDSVRNIQEIELRPYVSDVNHEEHVNV